MIAAFIILVVHYIADFIFQTEEMGVSKSKSFFILLKHTFVYTLVFYSAFIIIGIYDGVIGLDGFEITLKWFLFFPITFITHTLVDFLSTKIKSKQFINKQFYTKGLNFGFFSMIGLDQVIHYGILFLTYYFVTN
jgi:hypothetical protein